MHSKYIEEGKIANDIFKIKKYIDKDHYIQETILTELEF